MTRRDQELLNRQLRGLHIQPRHNGTMILAIVAVSNLLGELVAISGRKHLCHVVADHFLR